jgi:hypothetical protein
MVWLVRERVLTLAADDTSHAERSWLKAVAP